MLVVFFFFLFLGDVLNLDIYDIYDKDNIIILFIDMVDRVDKLKYKRGL